MEWTSVIIAIAGVVLGSGGIISIFNSRKVIAEARSIDNDTKLKMNSEIQAQLKELADIHKKESDELRAQNKELDKRIGELTNQINELMEWVVTDNNVYRSWLETELRKVNPDVEFPPCKPAPILRNQHNGNDE